MEGATNNNSDSENNKIETESVEKQRFPTLEVAQKKLEILMDKNFDKYGIRFANIEELKDLVKNKKFDFKEVFLPYNSNPFYQTGHKFNNFKEYFKIVSDPQFCPQWKDKPDDDETRGFSFERTAGMQTEWEGSLLTMFMYRELRDTLNEAHNEAIKEGVREVRKMTMQIFRNKVLEKMGGRWKTHGMWRATGGAGSPEALQNEIESIGIHSRNFASNNEEKNKVEEHLKLAKERLNIINDFVNNENFLMDDNKNLRKLIDAVVFSEPMYFKGVSPLQYHIMMVIHPDILNPQKNKGYNPNYWNKSEGEGLHKWDRICSNWKSDENEIKYLLGVVAVIPSKKLIEELKTLLTNSPENSTPIFDNRGEIRFP